MDEKLGLRERKKLAMRQKLRDVAISMFIERGFDNVSVAEIAEAAEVSAKTVFNYFPAKEDLAVGSDELAAEPAHAVRDRKPGQTPQDALFAGFRIGLDNRWPNTGLSDHPRVLGLVRVVQETPALAMRWNRHHYRTLRFLTEELTRDEAAPTELEARIIAVQIISVQLELIKENQRRIIDGASADEIYPDAVEQAERALALLDNGLGDVLRRR